MADLAVITPFGFSFAPVRFLRAWGALGCTKAQYYRNEKDAPDIAGALAAVREAGFTFDSIHGVFGEHLDPSSPDPAHRDHCLKVYRQEGQIACDLGGPMVVVHPACWNPGRREMTPDEIVRTAEPRWPNLHEFLTRLAGIGRELGVVYLIENQPLNCPLGHDVARLARAVRDANSPHIRMCLDTGHAHITGDLAASVRVAADVIAYLHIHDNDKRSDDHRMPGDGNTDWPAFSAALAETRLPATRMFEVFYDEDKIELFGCQGFGAQLRKWVAV